MHDRPSARRPRQRRGQLGTAAVFFGLLGQAEPLRSTFSYVRFVSGSGASLARSAHSLAWTRYCSARVVTTNTPFNR
jgi:hypothetical protein